MSFLDPCQHDKNKHEHSMPQTQLWSKKMSCLFKEKGYEFRMLQYIRGRTNTNWLAHGLNIEAHTIEPHGCLFML